MLYVLTANHANAGWFIDDGEPEDATGIIGIYSDLAKAKTRGQKFLEEECVLLEVELEGATLAWTESSERFISDTHEALEGTILQIQRAELDD
jgi:hypothetical protein